MAQARFDKVEWALATGRGIVSLTIAYLFLVVLMTATAQQRVAATLERADGSMSYSSAFAKVRAIEADTEALNKLKSSVEALRASVRRLEMQGADAVADRDGAWASLARLERRVAATAPSECGLSSDPPAADAEARLVAWNNMLDCLRAGGVPNRLAEQLNQAMAQHDYVKLKQAADRGARDLAQAQAELERTQRQFTEAQTSLEAAQSLKATFDDLSVLRATWYTAGNLLVEFPPSLLQIILAFISGLFGALLVTIILIVYPNNSLATARGARYLSRLLLGGLISVVVYVMLGGGSAVLGNTNPFGESQGNYMTFCAVGVLAGMFSDRVAAWLSERANTFFAAGDGGDRDTPGASGGVGGGAETDTTGAPGDELVIGDAPANSDKAAETRPA